MLLCGEIERSDSSYCRIKSLVEVHGKCLRKNMLQDYENFLHWLEGYLEANAENKSFDGIQKKLAALREIQRQHPEEYEARNIRIPVLKYDGGI